MASRPSRSTPTEPRASARAFALADFKEGRVHVLVARRTSPRAASISRTCRSSSTTSCRRHPRRTSTGSAGPASAGLEERGDLARLRRRGRSAARHPADAQARDPVGGRGGLHPRSQRRAALDHRHRPGAAATCIGPAASCDGRAAESLRPADPNPARPSIVARISFDRSLDRSAGLVQSPARQSAAVVDRSPITDR